ncbi:MAG: HEAT repeat domain-containing protein [Caldilineaceae bacterium]|nr:HEAT repeat domain-containing protein [Caldilineaceae bacterium]
MLRPRASYHYQIEHPRPLIRAADGAPATPEMLHWALQDADPAVRVSAALDLAQTGDLAPAVTRLLFAAADWRGQPEAGSLARGGIAVLAATNPAFVNSLLAAVEEGVQTDPADGPIPLSGVADCLGNIGLPTPLAVDRLRALAQHCQATDPYTCVSALRSLLCLGAGDATVVDGLLVLGDQDDPLVTAMALDALGMAAPSARVVARLTDGLAASPHVAAAAARSVGRFAPANPTLQEALIHTAASPDWRVRRAAVAGLSSIPNPAPAVVELFCRALDDGDWTVRCQAVEALGNLDAAPAHVLERLLAVLADEPQPDSDLRGDVALTLAQLGCVNDAVIAAFLTELQSADASVRERAARNWWLLGTDQPSTVNALNAALDDPAELVRTSAAASLAWLHGE